MAMADPEPDATGSPHADTRYIAPLAEWTYALGRLHDDDSDYDFDVTLA